MVATPWGRPDELRSRRLRPGPGTSRAEVERNQRERLFGAMVATVAEHGYEKTRVADLLAISGVSRNTFYKHFSNKQDCFLATLDAVAEVGAKRVVDAYLGHDGPWDEQLAAALDALTASIVEQPAAARLYYVESFAAGGEALARVERMEDRVEQLGIEALERSPRHTGMPRDLVRAVLRGVRRVIQTRLRGGRESELVADGPVLLRWALGYPRPPEPLRAGDAPDTGVGPPAADPEDPRERILAAVIELMAEKGYQALTINDIAQRAAVSLTTFYKRFDGKQEAVAAALQPSVDRLLAAVTPAYREAPDWPHAIGAALHAFFEFLQRERPLARFGGVDVYSAGRLVVEARDDLLDAAQAFMAEGYRLYPDVNPIAGEAIGASIDALIFDRVLREGPAGAYELAPTATYLALVPFVGAEQACAIANASR